MKSKTINAVLTKKIKQWTDTIKDSSLRERVKKEVIVTGGCIASMLLGEKISDFDVYLRTKQTTIDLANYYVAKFKPPKFEEGCEVGEILVQEEENQVKIVVISTGVATERDENCAYFESMADGTADEYLQEVYGLEDAQDLGSGEFLEMATEGVASKEGENAYVPIFLSSNAITLSDKIQIVIRFYGEPEQIHENYDFVHCMNYWTSWDKQVVLKKEALESLITRELRYHGSLYPLTSVIRTRKFITRGWTINAGQYLKMIMQLNLLDLTDVKVLEEQLIGVDVAFFSELIQLMKEKNPDSIDSTYLIEIIDRMF